MYTFAGEPGLIILLGVAIRHYEWLPEAFFPSIEKFSYNIAFPALLFSSTARLSFHSGQVGELALATLLPPGFRQVTGTLTSTGFYSFVLQTPGRPSGVLNALTVAANKITAADYPYVWGGGHGQAGNASVGEKGPGYNGRRIGFDCSGSVGFALHGGGLLSQTEDSGQMETYGSPGHGQWITVWANAGHAYANIAGLWFDTAAQSSSNGNDRWSTRRASPDGGFVARHPAGY